MRHNTSSHQLTKVSYKSHISQYLVCTLTDALVSIYQNTHISQARDMGGNYRLIILVSAKNLWLFHGFLFSRTADIMDV